MQSDIISLQTLYAFVGEHTETEALNGRSPIGKDYFRRVGEITVKIATDQGFYLWGKYEAKGLWRNIYLGKAGFGKTANLRSRITEELKDERCCLWRSVLTVEELLAIGAHVYSSMWNQYKHHWERSFRKTGATHVAWVSDSALSNVDVANIESDLIETLNPSGNVSRPVPPVSLQEHTHEVIRHLRSAIHKERDCRYTTLAKSIPQVLGASMSNDGGCVG